MHMALLVTANNLFFVLKTKIHALCRCFLELSMLIFTNVKCCTTKAFDFN